MVSRASVVSQGSRARSEDRGQGHIVRERMMMKRLDLGRGTVIGMAAVGMAAVGMAAVGTVAVSTVAVSTVAVGTVAVGTVAVGTVAVSVIKTDVRTMKSLLDSVNMIGTDTAEVRTNVVSESAIPVDMTTIIGAAGIGKVEIVAGTETGNDYSV